MIKYNTRMCITVKVHVLENEKLHLYICGTTACEKRDTGGIQKAKV
jgi:hypothetical protein